MREPVLLPTSDTIVDRSVIVRCLLSDEIDPFNRKPLTEADLVPQPALKARIDAYVAEKRAA
eukprot:CAMPEP_0198343914 /NCGR_PEP_ID=MMETSP1450-20131203/63743_1 /TAXON_ID=753684 ORGANISM="Madagascaria erythrocladiodes, Strain CCMP3234" /NCGR_SAMPLE_ID=MMETSP1450 /ASSEMBLY_ACC=CAM_ASM_001115 /LENGTH=61 /DNA_ID=CAMNT_0044049127 /DNA_START=1 /DNA_END=182 /DNA_ORIENTATION=-